MVKRKKGDGLWDHQIPVYNQMINDLKTNDIVVVGADTGFGKTELIKVMTLDYPKARFLILAHGQDVVRTNFVDRLEGEPALKKDVYALRKGADASVASKFRIVVSLPQTVHRCVKKLGKFDFIVVDEAHQFYGEDKKMYANILANITTSKIILLSASHFKLDYPKAIFSKEESRKINKVPDVNIELEAVDVDIDDEDYNDSGILKTSVQLNARSAEETVRDWISKKEQLPALVVVHSIQAADSMLAFLKRTKVGKKLRIASSHSKNDSKSLNLEAFKAGKLDVLIVVDRATLSFDYPELITVIDASYSLNVIRVQQVFGRLRLHPKESKNKFKKFVKFAPANRMADFYLVMTAVLALGVREIYATWKGDYKNLKLVLKKPVDETIKEIQLEFGEGIKSPEKAEGEVGGEEIAGEEVEGETPTKKDLKGEAEVVSIPPKEIEENDDGGGLREPSFELTKPKRRSLRLDFGEYIDLVWGEDCSKTEIYLSNALNACKSARGERVLDVDGRWAKAKAWAAENPGRRPSQHSKDPEEKSIAKWVSVMRNQRPDIDAWANLVGWMKTRKTQEENAALIEDFIEKTGRRPSSISKDPEEKKLGIALHNLLKNDDFRNSNPELVEKWNALKTMKTQEENAALIEDFIEKNGRRPSSTAKDPEEKKLGMTLSQLLQNDNFRNSNPELVEKWKGLVKLNRQKATAKPIFCITSKQYFRGATYAGEILGIDATNITAVCKGKKKTAKGHTFRYCTDAEIAKIESGKIKCVDG